MIFARANFVKVLRASHRDPTALSLRQNWGSRKSIFKNCPKMFRSGLLMTRKTRLHHKKARASTISA